MQKKFLEALKLDIFDGEGTAPQASDGATTGEIADTTPQDTAVDTGDAQADAEPKDEPSEKEPTFEELIKGKFKDSYQKSVQKIINGKFKESKVTQARMEKAMPIFDILADKFGITDTNNIDVVIDELAKKMQSDTSIYEKEAMEKGISSKEYAQDRQRELENIRLKREIESYKQAEQNNRDREIVEGWQRQAEALKDQYPNLDLGTELQNKDFTDLLGLNYDIKTAYEIVHRDELAQGAIQEAIHQTQKKTVDNIRARGMRPRENGLSSNGVADVKKKTISEMSNSEILKLAEKAMRGEKIEL